MIMSTTLQSEVIDLEEGYVDELKASKTLVL